MKPAFQVSFPFLVLVERIFPMNTYKRLIALLLCAVMVFSFSACNSTDDAYIYFTLSEPPQTLDPQIAHTDSELMIVRNIFEGLLRKDSNGKIVCGVAEKYSKNGLEYTFTLREDATWSNEQPITAHDFVFAFSRALDPKTKAPHSKQLINIHNAKDILNGKKSPNSLGVKAITDRTLKITLTKEDKNFEEVLTSAITMPCNEEFFKESSGKYGLEKETTLSNGSYRLAKWGKDIFGIRLYRNDYYGGDFTAQNAAVFFTIDQKQTTAQSLQNNDADIVFVNPNEITTIDSTMFHTASVENICWVLTISDGFSKGIRKSLISLASPQVFQKNLPKGYSGAKNLFPEVLNTNADISGMPIYNLKSAKKLFASEVTKLKDKKFPTDVVLYYYDDTNCKTMITDIVGHWQNQLGAFVNIESVSSPDVLIDQLKEQTYAMCIFPVSADTPYVKDYLDKFGINYSGQNLSQIQSTILNQKNIVPLANQITTVAYNKKLSNVKFTHGNGYIDFSFVIKED